MLEEVKPKISLYKALKLGYTRNEKKQQKALKKYGYVLDKELTNEREHVIAYNPQQKKLLFIGQGTDPKSIKDVATDVDLALGAIKQTKRYEDDKNALLKAKKKYDVDDKNITLVGHSLSGQIVSGIAPSKSQVYTYNPAFTIGQKPRENVQNYRTAGDIVSLLAPSENTTTLENENATARPVNYLLKTHAIENIKDLPVFF